MKHIIFALCLWLPSVLSGSIIERVHICPEISTYLDYYHGIAAAEDSAVNANYTSAIAQYWKIFEEYPYNNHIDCYVAAQLASYIDDTASCADFIYRGLSFGLPVQTIVGNPHLKERFLKLNRQTVDSCWGTYCQLINQPDLFIHHCNAWPLVSDLLWNELLKGNITPKMYGVIYETSNGKSDYHNTVNYFASRPCWRQKCKGLIRKHVSEINEARWSIGLEKYEVMEKKFESTKRYHKWCSKGTDIKKPFFDFQCDLSFKGIRFSQKSVR